MTPADAFDKRYDPLRFGHAAPEVKDAWLAAWTISSAITEGIMADMMLKDEALLRKLKGALEVIANLEHPLHKVMKRRADKGHIVTIYPHQVAVEAIAMIEERLK